MRRVLELQRLWRRRPESAASYRPLRPPTRRQGERASARTLRSTALLHRSPRPHLAMASRASASTSNPCMTSDSSGLSAPTAAGQSKYGERHASITFRRARSALPSSSVLARRKRSRSAATAGFSASGRPCASRIGISISAATPSTVERYGSTSRASSATSAADNPSRLIRALSHRRAALTSPAGSGASMRVIGWAAESATWVGGAGGDSA